MSLPGAMSLRRQLLRASAARSKKNFYASGAMGSDAGQKAHADAAEVAVGVFLSSVGIVFETEAALNDRRLRNTPDFRINATINGCFWIEVKTYYGTSMLAGNKSIPIGDRKSVV